MSPPTVAREDCSRGEHLVQGSFSENLELEGRGERERDGFYPRQHGVGTVEHKWRSDKVSPQRVTMMKEMHTETQLSLQDSTV